MTGTATPSIWRWDQTPSCSDLQTRSRGLENKSRFEPTIRANIGGLEPTLAANELRFIAISSPTAM